MIAERAQTTSSETGVNRIGLVDDSQVSGRGNGTKGAEVSCQIGVEIADPLETLMSEIRSDASADPVQYLLRSNTWHDGE